MPSTPRTLSLLFLLTLSCLAPAQTPNPLATATAAVRAHNDDLALEITAAALRETPDNLMLIAIRGVAFLDLHQPAPALETFQSALTLSPNYLPALEGAAQAAYQLGGDKALPYVNHILTLVPTEPAANAMHADFDYRAGDCAAAIDHFALAQVILNTLPAPEAHYGACLAALNRLSEAIPILTHVLEILPNDPVARYNLALAQSNSGQPDEALATLAPLLTTPTPPEDILTLAADLYESKNETQRAVDLLRQAILAHPRDKAAYLQFATLSYKHSSIQVGVDMLNAGLTQLPTEPDLYVARGVLLSQTAHSADAMNDFDTATRLDPNLSFVQAAEGIARSQAHDSAAALATFRTAAKDHPDDGLTQYLFAEALSEQTPAPNAPTFTEAITAASRAVAIDPKRQEAHDLLASLYLRAGDTPHCLTESQLALALDPNDEQALYYEILAKRKGSDKSEVPALVQRLMAVRQAKAADQKQSRVYRLVEAPQ